MILSLAEKLGKQGLLAYSLHPGLIITTGLCAHIDFGSAVAELCTSEILFLIMAANSHTTAI